MNSMILSYLILIFNKCSDLFQHSFFNKIQVFVKNIWCKLTKNSCFARWFSKYPKGKEIFESSQISYVLHKIYDVLSKIVCWLFGIVDKSKIVSSVKYFYRNCFNISIKDYSIVIAGFITSFCFGLFMRDDLTIKMIVISSILLMVCFFSLFINSSILVLLKNSLICKYILQLFELKSIENNKTKELRQGELLKFLLTFGVVGFLSGVWTPLILFAVIGLLCLGFLCIDYRIALFSSIILMPILPTMIVVVLVLLSVVIYAIDILKNGLFLSLSVNKTPLDFYLILFVGILGVSTITSFTLFESIKVFLVYFTFILGFYLITKSVNSKEQLYSLLNGMIFVGGIVALYGIYQYVFGFEEGRIWTDNNMFEDIKTRVVSTFENPNVLGEYLLLLIPLSVGYIFSKKEVMLKSINIITTILLSLCMVFTYSRGNWIGLMIAMVLFFMFYNGKIVWWGVIALLFVPLFVPDVVMNRLMSVGDVADTSTSYRVNIWYGTWEMLKDYWLIGTGLGTDAFSSVYQHYCYEGVNAFHSHNLYLQLISENGVLGLFLFVVIILTYYKMCISTIVKCKDKVMKATITGLSAGMFGYLVQGMFDNVWYNYRIVYMFFIILALTCSAIMICRRDEKIYE